MRNKGNLYNFSEMGYEEINDVNIQQCKKLCSEVEGCSFYEFTEAFDQDGSLCKYVTSWPYSTEKVKSISDDVAQKIS